MRTHCRRSGSRPRSGIRPGPRCRVASQHETSGSSRSTLASVAGGAWEPALAPGRDDGRLVAESSEPATMAKLTELPSGLHPDLAEALAAFGVESLYSHQAEAFATAREKELILTSGTASGKSLSFNLPVLDGIAHDPMRRA